MLKELHPQSFLSRVVEKKRQEIAEFAQVLTLKEMQRQAQKSDRDFTAALARPGLSLIAELKKASPSRGLLRPDFNLQAIVAIYERHAQAISVLLDQSFFQGSLYFLRQAREVCTKPLLGKEFIIDEHQIWMARYFDADAVLLMASLLEAKQIEQMLSLLRRLNMEALVEVHDEQEVAQVLNTSAKIIGINNRDLNTLKIDEENFYKLAPLIRRFKPEALLVAESGVSEVSQIKRLQNEADAVLIGTHFMLAEDIELKIKELGW